MLTQVRDLDAVGEAWRALECRANPSFFQSWTWVGCLAAERFTDPVLLRAERHGSVVGLGLFNRRRGSTGLETLWLNQSGNPSLDSVFVEHNGLLLAHDAADLLPACLATVLNGGSLPGGWWRRLWGLRVRLSGVDPRHLSAAQQTGSALVVGDSVAPYVDLTALANEPDAYLASLSANTRYQIRRSNRCLSRLGPLVVRHAMTLPEALAWLESMAAMHQAVWTARGQPGAFGTPEFLRFHRALLGRALPRGEVELLRISAGPHVLGYLYNFRLGNRVLSYQSGFDYKLARALAGPHAKPGLKLPSRGNPASPGCRRGVIRFPGRTESLQAQPGATGEPTLLAGHGASRVPATAGTLAAPCPTDAAGVGLAAALWPSFSRAEFAAKVAGEPQPRHLIRGKPTGAADHIKRAGRAGPFCSTGADAAGSGGQAILILVHRRFDDVLRGVADMHLDDARARRGVKAEFGIAGGPAPSGGAVRLHRVPAAEQPRMIRRDRPADHPARAPPRVRPRRRAGASRRARRRDRRGWWHATSAAPSRTRPARRRHSGRRAGPSAGSCGRRPPDAGPDPAWSRAAAR